MPFDFPAGPNPGDVFTDPISGASFTWNGYAWMGGAANSLGALIVSDTPPAAPANNSLWFESDTGMLFLRYNDGNSSQWVQLNALPNGAGYMPLRGVTDGSDAPAGQIGEFVRVNTASTIALTTIVWTNLANISLTAGDWDVWGAAQFTASIGALAMQAGITLVSATSPASIPVGGAIASIAGPSFTSSILTVPTVRFSFSSTTTVYLIGQENFSSGTAAATANSFIMARRVR